MRTYNTFQFNLLLDCRHLPYLATHLSLILCNERHCLLNPESYWYNKKLFQHFCRNPQFLENLNLNHIQKQVHTFTLEIKQTIGKSIGGERERFFQPAILQLSIFLKEIIKQVSKDICIWVFIAIDWISGKYCKQLTNNRGLWKGTAEHPPNGILWSLEKRWRNVCDILSKTKLSLINYKKRWQKNL